MRNARTLTRLIWFHVPLKLSPHTAEDARTAEGAEGADKGRGKGEKGREEVRRVMREKRMALDLVDG